MIVFPLDNEQDTITFQSVTSKDTLIGDTTLSMIKSGNAQAARPVVKAYNNDTTLVCRRNSVADVSFRDSSGFLRTIDVTGVNKTVFQIAEKTNNYNTEKREKLLSHLNNGEEVSGNMFGTDWILVVLILSALLFSIAKSSSGNLKSSLNLLLFRGSKDADYSESGGFFHWQSTLLNIISFSITGLFIFHTASHYGNLSYPVTGLMLWLISFAVIVFAFSLRNIVCFITGSLSGQKEAFKEYLSVIHRSYHAGAVILFILVVLISYATVIPSSVLLTAGFVTVGLIYLFRVGRLLIIFINRSISIFYLILYLCALEILPVAIAIRYFSALV